MQAGCLRYIKRYIKRCIEPKQSVTIMKPRAPYVEKLDSSAAQTRALAAALRGRHFDPFGFGIGARSVLRMFPLVPDEIIPPAISLAAGVIGIPQSAAQGVRTEDMAADVTSLYPKRQYNTMFIGAPNGAVSHMGTIMDAPFLTSHFLLCFRHFKNADDVYSAARVGRRLAIAITRNNRDLHAVIHFDPVHDRPVLAFITHVRPKLLGMPHAYGDFIRENLAPGGALVLVNCRYPWLQYKFRERVTFQIGGLGGIPDSAFIVGSKGINKYLEDRGSFLRGGWRLKNSPHRLEIQPESEWGCMREFTVAVRSFAATHGMRLITLTADHPEKYSELAFEMHREASRRDGEEPLFLFADCFNQLDPYMNIRSRALPLWLPYYDEMSFDLARRTIRKVPSDTQVIFTMHPSFSYPFDMVPLKKWIKLFTLDSPPMLLGINAKKFPFDMSYMYDFGPHMRRFSEKHIDPVNTRLSPEDLVAVAKRVGLEVQE